MSEISKRAGELIDTINHHMAIIENSESVLADVEAPEADIAILSEGDELSFTDLTSVLNEEQRAEVKKLIACIIHQNMKESEDFLEGLTSKKEEPKEEPPKKATRKKATK